MLTLTPPPVDYLSCWKRRFTLIQGSVDTKEKVGGGGSVVWQWCLWWWREVEAQTPNSLDLDARAKRQGFCWPGMSHYFVPMMWYPDHLRMLSSLVKVEFAHGGCHMILPSSCYRKCVSGEERKWVMLVRCVAPWAVLNFYLTTLFIVISFCCFHQLGILGN